MICVSIGDVTFEECLAALEKTEFAEIRIDTMAVDAEDIRTIFSRPKRLIATCRPGTKSDEERKALLSEAVAAGASYIDIEAEAGDAFKKNLVEKARKRGCRVIVSHHDFEKTPSRADLERIIERSFEDGADIVKIACRVLSHADNARLLGLLDGTRSLIVLGMGPLGKISRIVAPFLGSPFTYASPVPGKETAEGQIDLETLREIFRSLGNV